MAKISGILSALVFALLVVVLPTAVFGETLSKIAVVDWVQIVENFPGDSAVLRRYKHLGALCCRPWPLEGDLSQNRIPL